MNDSCPVDGDPFTPSDASGASAASRRLAELLRSEQARLGDFLLALAEFDRERLWVKLGHASLYAFLQRDLGLCNASAFYRSRTTFSRSESMFYTRKLPAAVAAAIPAICFSYVW